MGSRVPNGSFLSPPRLRGASSSQELRNIARTFSHLSMLCIACAPGPALTQVGGCFSDVGSSLETVGECLSPLDVRDLSGVFEEAPNVTWAGTSTILADGRQPPVQAFFENEIGDKIEPRHYTNSRYYNLGPLSAGESFEVTFVHRGVHSVYLMDETYTLLAGYEQYGVADFPLSSRLTVDRDIPQAFARVLLYSPHQRGEPLVSINRIEQQRPPSGHTVVLSFGGIDDLRFRSDYLRPSSVAPLTDPVLRDNAVAAFRETFAPYNLRVLTDADPPPADAHSIIYIGTVDPPFGYNGISELVDGGNHVRNDVAVVDIKASQLSIASLLGRETYGRAIGKVAAHEMGHLLGLWHVISVDTLMTARGCQGTFLDPARLIERDFGAAPIYILGDNISAGYQDAPAYLLRVLGPAAE